MRMKMMFDLDIWCAGLKVNATGHGHRMKMTTNDITRRDDSDEPL